VFDCFIRIFLSNDLTSPCMLIVLINVRIRVSCVRPLLICMKSLIGKKTIKTELILISEQKFHTVIGTYIAIPILNLSTIHMHKIGPSSV